MKTAIRNFIAILVFSGALVCITYGLAREQFLEIALLYFVAFGALALIYKSNVSIKWAIALACAIRLAMVWAVPNLSDDIYRFLWDGLLVIGGENPYVHTPEYYMSLTNVPAFVKQDLFTLLNSPNYFTVYPPLSQFVYTTGAYVSGGNIMAFGIVIKSILVIFDIGNIFLLRALLLRFKVNSRNLLLYALNPLVILEISANAHFESIMVFYLLASLWFLFHNKVKISGLMMGLSVAAKLLPLIFIPAILFRIEKNKIIPYLSMVILVQVFLWMPFLSPTLFYNIGSSIGLYFHTFEFNASIYHMVNWLAAFCIGHPPHALVATMLAIATLLSILLLAFLGRKLKLETVLAISASVYFLLSTTVHPWYLVLPLALGTLANLRFTLVWTLVAVLSYSAYNGLPYQENHQLVALEYLVVVLFLYLDYKKMVVKINK